MDENDIYKVYDHMEKDLIASLKRNLKRHNKEQEKVGFEFPQWQAMKLRDIQRVRYETRKIVNKRAKGLSSDIRSIIRNEYKQGKRLAYKNHKDKFGNDARVKDDFFKTDNRKVEAIIDELLGTQREAKYAIYRKTDDIYKKTIAKASMFYEHGTVGLNKAVDMAIKDFEQAGMNIIEYKDGSRHKISNYSRMAIRTASQRAMLHGMGDFRKEIGNPYVRPSRHGGACPLCIPWEGKILIDDVYSDGKPDGKHKLLSEAMKQGLFHPNCAHGLPTYYPELEEVRKEIFEEEIWNNNSDNDIMNKISNLPELHKQLIQLGKQTGNEYLAFTNLEGELIFKLKEGASNNVTISQEMIDKLNTCDADSIICVHNHPSSSSFSPSDINVISKLDSIKEIQAIGHDATIYRLSIADGKRLDFSEITEQYEQYKKESFDKYQKRAFQGEDIRLLWKEHSNEIVTKMSKENGWKYEKKEKRI